MLKTYVKYVKNKFSILKFSVNNYILQDIFNILASIAYNSTKNVSSAQLFNKTY